MSLRTQPAGGVAFEELGIILPKFTGTLIDDGWKPSNKALRTDAKLPQRCDAALLYYFVLSAPAHLAGTLWHQS